MLTGDHGAGNFNGAGDLAPIYLAIHYLAGVAYPLRYLIAQAGAAFDPSVLPIINALLSYGPIGLMVVILGLLAKSGADWYRSRQKRIDDLSDTMIGSLKIKDLEHGTALRDIVESLERSETYKREISKQLADIQNEQRQQRTFIMLLARVIPAKDTERRRTLNETEIRTIVKAIKEEYPSP